MRVAEYKQIGTDIIEEKRMVQYLDQNGAFSDEHEETVTREVPRFGIVYRDMTPEEEAEQARAQAEAEANAEPVPPEIVYISREDFNLLDATKDGIIYYVTESNGTLTMIKGDNK